MKKIDRTCMCYSKVRPGVYAYRLDGKEQRRVLFADAERGVLTRYATDEDGGIILDDDNEPTRQTLTGTVEIEVPDDWQAPFPACYSDIDCLYGLGLPRRPMSGNNEEGS